MFGWFSEARTLVSRANLASRSGASVKACGNTLSATSRSSVVSRPRIRLALAPDPEWHAREDRVPHECQQSPTRAQIGEAPRKLLDAVR